MVNYKLLSLPLFLFWTSCGQPLIESERVDIADTVVQDSSISSDRSMINKEIRRLTALTKPRSKGNCVNTWPVRQQIGRKKGIGAFNNTKRQKRRTFRTSRDGEIIKNVEVNGRIYVRHNNVVIYNSVLNGDKHYSVYTSDGVKNLTIVRSNLHRQPHIGKSTGFKAIGNLVRGTNISKETGHMDNGFIFSADNVQITHNYIYDLYGSPGNHADGIQVMGGKNTSIRSNWIQVDKVPGDAVRKDGRVLKGGINSAVFFKPDKDKISGALVECNMIVQNSPKGAGYYPIRLYGGSRGKVIPIKGRIIVRGNRFMKGHMGRYAGFFKYTSIPVWKNNLYVDKDPAKCLLVTDKRKSHICDIR